LKGSWIDFNALLRLEAQRLEIEREKSRQEMLLAREIQDSFLLWVPRNYRFAGSIRIILPAHAVGEIFILFIR